MWYSTKNIKIRTQERIRNLGKKLEDLKNLPENEQGIDYYCEIHRYRMTIHILKRKLHNIQRSKPMLGDLSVPATTIGADKKFPSNYN